MRAEYIEVDSAVLGSAVLAIHDYDADADFAAFERAYLAEYKPRYVSAKVPMEDLRSIHALEDAGFQLVECQIRSAVRLRRCFDVAPYPYRMERVEREEDAGAVLDIAGSTFVHDRFSQDPAIAADVSGRRYREYVLKSLRAPGEAVYRLIECATGETVAFKTHAYEGGEEARLLLGGVRSDLKNAGLGVVSEYFEFNELIRKGVKRVVTHISASNYPIFNLEIGQLGFRVVQTFAVLRRAYSA